jgi:putative SOS response-associated peptidase YedK
MCGRYALSLNASQVRRRFAEEDHLAVDDVEVDDRTRQSYNFAPGYHGLVYRAVVAHQGDGEQNADAEHGASSQEQAPGAADQSTPSQKGNTTELKYKLQSMKWGLIPFWTKRPPDYGSQLKTINCRNDSLIEDRGMWTTMKKHKRCIVVAEGFYEWLKKNNGKEKIPHFVKRKDGQLMLLAGLWDSVTYEGSEEKLYTYTIITTDSNKQLNFLHDRMPVILEPDSEGLKNWLDPTNNSWSKELQNLLRPYSGELDCYPVDKDVGKVGNNSPLFVVPVDSKDNKKNIANFFSTQRATADHVAVQSHAAREAPFGHGAVDETETRDTTMKVESTEDNAPLPKIKSESDEKLAHEMDANVTDTNDASPAHEKGGLKRTISKIEEASELRDKQDSPRKQIKTEESTPSPVKNLASQSKQNVRSSGRKMRSATSNNTVGRTPPKSDNTKITSFFVK